jgi:dihydroneopterin aldolase
MMITESFIYLRALRFHAYHGVEAQERLTGNDYLMDIRIGTDVKRATETDDVHDTINYAEVYEIARHEMLIPSDLIEHVAGRVAQALLDHWSQIQTLDIRLTKLNPPMGADCEGAGIELHLINDKTLR